MFSDLIKFIENKIRMWIYYLLFKIGIKRGVVSFLISYMGEFIRIN